MNRIPSNLTSNLMSSIADVADNTSCTHLLKLEPSKNIAASIIPLILKCSLNLKYNVTRWLDCIDYLPHDSDTQIEFLENLNKFCKKVQSIPLNHENWTSVVKAIIRLCGNHIIYKDNFVCVVKIFQYGLKDSNPDIQKIGWKNWLYLSQHITNLLNPDTYGPNGPTVLKLFLVPFKPSLICGDSDEIIIFKVEILSHLLNNLAPIHYDPSYRIVNAILTCFYKAPNVNVLKYNESVCIRITKLYLEMLKQPIVVGHMGMDLLHAFDKVVLCLCNSIQGEEKHDLLVEIWSRISLFKDVKCRSEFKDTLNSDLTSIYNTYFVYLTKTNHLNVNISNALKSDQYKPLKLISVFDQMLTSDNVNAANMLDYINMYIKSSIADTEYDVKLFTILTRHEFLLQDNKRMIDTLVALKDIINPQYVSVNVFYAILECFETFHFKYCQQSLPTQHNLLINEVWIFFVTYYSELVSTNIIKVNDSSQFGEHDYNTAHQLLLFPTYCIQWTTKVCKIWKQVYNELANTAALETTAKDNLLTETLLKKLVVKTDCTNNEALINILFFILFNNHMSGHEEVSKFCQETLISLIPSFSKSDVDILINNCISNSTKPVHIAPIVNHLVAMPGDTMDLASKTKVFKLQRDLKKLRQSVSKTSTTPRAQKGVPKTSPKTGSRFFDKLSSQTIPKGKSNSLLMKESASPNTKKKSDKLNTSIHEEGDTQDYVFIQPKESIIPLTQHQKEKFKCRSENIPALYQDLSQNSMNSQDSNSQDCLVLNQKRKTIGNIDIDENATDLCSVVANTEEIRKDEETLNEINIDNQNNKLVHEEDIVKVGSKKEFNLSKTKKSIQQYDIENENKNVEIGSSEAIGDETAETKLDVPKTRNSLKNKSVSKETLQLVKKTRNSMKNKEEDKTDVDNTIQEDPENNEKRTTRKSVKVKTPSVEKINRKSLKKSEQIENVTTLDDNAKEVKTPTVEKINRKSLKKSEQIENVTTLDDNVEEVDIKVETPRREKIEKIEVTPTRKPSERKQKSPFNSEEFIFNLPNKRKSLNTSRSSDSQGSKKLKFDDGQNEVVEKKSATRKSILTSTEETNDQKAEEKVEITENVSEEVEKNKNVDPPKKKQIKKSILKNAKIADDPVDSEVNKLDDARQNEDNPTKSGTINTEKKEDNVMDSIIESVVSEGTDHMSEGTTFINTDMEQQVNSNKLNEVQENESEMTEQNELVEEQCVNNPRKSILKNNKSVVKTGETNQVTIEQTTLKVERKSIVRISKNITEIPETQIEEKVAETADVKDVNDVESTEIVETTPENMQRKSILKISTKLSSVVTEETEAETADVKDLNDVDCTDNFNHKNTEHMRRKSILKISTKQYPVDVDEENLNKRKSVKFNSNVILSGTIEEEKTMKDLTENSIANKTEEPAKIEQQIEETNHDTTHSGHKNKEEHKTISVPTETDVKVRIYKDVFQNMNWYRNNEFKIKNIDQINSKPILAYDKFKSKILYNNIKMLFSRNNIYALTDNNLRSIFSKDNHLLPQAGSRTVLGDNTLDLCQTTVLPNNTTVFPNDTVASMKSIRSNNYTLPNHTTIFLSETIGTHLQGYYNQLNSDVKLNNKYHVHFIAKNNGSKSFNIISNFNMILLNQEISLDVKDININSLWEREDERNNILQDFEGLNSCNIFLVTFLCEDKNIITKSFKKNLVEKLKNMNTSGDAMKHIVKYVDYTTWTYVNDLDEDFNIYDCHDRTLLRTENLKFNFYAAHPEKAKEENTLCQAEDEEMTEIPQCLNENTNDKIVETAPELKPVTPLHTYKSVVEKEPEPAASVVQTTPKKIEKIIESEIVYEQNTEAICSPGPKPKILNLKNFINAINPKNKETSEDGSEEKESSELNGVTTCTATVTTPDNIVTVLPPVQVDKEELNSNKDVKDKPLEIPETQTEEVLDYEEDQTLKDESEKEKDLSSEPSSLDIIESSQESSNIELLKSPKTKSSEKFAMKKFAHSTPFHSKMGSNQINLSDSPTTKSMKSVDEPTTTSYGSSKSLDTLEKPVTDFQFSDCPDITQIRSPRKSTIPTNASPRKSLSSFINKTDSPKKISNLIKTDSPARLSIPPPQVTNIAQITTPNSRRTESPRKLFSASSSSSNDEKRHSLITSKKTTPPQQTSSSGRVATMMELLESSSMIKKRITPTRVSAESSPSLSSKSMMGESPKSSRRSSRMISLIKSFSAEDLGSTVNNERPTNVCSTPTERKWSNKETWTPNRTPTSGILRAFSTGKKKLKVNFMENPVSEELHFDSTKETLNNSKHILHYPNGEDCSVIVGKKLQFNSSSDDNQEVIDKVVSAEKILESSSLVIKETIKTENDCLERENIEQPTTETASNCEETERTMLDHEENLNVAENIKQEKIEPIEVIESKEIIIEINSHNDCEDDETQLQNTQEQETKDEHPSNVTTQKDETVHEEDFDTEFDSFVDDIEEIMDSQDKEIVKERSTTLNETYSKDEKDDITVAGETIDVPSNMEVCDRTSMNIKVSKVNDLLQPEDKEQTEEIIENYLQDKKHFRKRRFSGLFRRSETRTEESINQHLSMTKTDNIVKTQQDDDNHPEQIEIVETIGTDCTVDNNGTFISSDIKSTTADVENITSHLEKLCKKSPRKQNLIELKKTFDEEEETAVVSEEELEGIHKLIDTSDNDINASLEVENEESIERSIEEPLQMSESLNTSERHTAASHKEKKTLVKQPVMIQNTPTKETPTISSNEIPTSSPCKSTEVSNKETIPNETRLLRKRTLSDGDNIKSSPTKMTLTPEKIKINDENQQQISEVKVLETLRRSSMRKSILMKVAPDNTPKEPCSDISDEALFEDSKYEVNDKSDSKYNSSTDVSLLCNFHDSVSQSYLDDNSECHITQTPLSLNQDNAPIYLPLVHCSDPICDIYDYLCVDMSQKNMLQMYFDKLGIKTIGNVASMLKLQANNIPLGKCKIDKLLEAFDKYFDTKKRRNSSIVTNVTIDTTNMPSPDAIIQENDKLIREYTNEIEASNEKVNALKKQMNELLENIMKEQYKIAEKQVAKKRKIEENNELNVKRRKF